MITPKKNLSNVADHMEGAKLLGMEWFVDGACISSGRAGRASSDRSGPPGRLARGPCSRRSAPVDCTARCVVVVRDLRCWMR